MRGIGVSPIGSFGNFSSYWEKLPLPVGSGMYLKQYSEQKLLSRGTAFLDSFIALRHPIPLPPSPRKGENILFMRETVSPS